VYTVNATSADSKKELRRRQVNTLRCNNIIFDFTAPFKTVVCSRFLPSESQDYFKDFLPIMTRLPLYILASMPLIALGMKKRSSLDAFGLFAYTEGIGGQPLFYANGRH
jgi:hypothetical protein